MTLKEILLEKKASVLERWFNLTVQTYPPDTAKFLGTRKNRFDNPVGVSLREAMENIYQGLIDGDEPTKAARFLDNVVRVRAIQDFTAAEAVSFVFVLKAALRQELNSWLANTGALSDALPDVLPGYLAFESRIDELALLCFDIFMKCRETIYEIKANEVKDRTYRLLQMANLTVDVQQGPDAQEGGNPPVKPGKEVEK